VAVALFEAQRAARQRLHRHARLLQQRARVDLQRSRAVALRDVDRRFLGEVWPLPVESSQMAHALSRQKVSLTLPPNVVVPEIVQAVGASGPKVMVSAIVGPRPLCVTL
jgi:hypothetical protein